MQDELRPLTPRRRVRIGTIVIASLIGLFVLASVVIVLGLEGY